MLADPLPGKLIFNIFLKYSQSQNISSNSDFQNSETVEYERELGWIEMSLFTLGFGFPQINGWYRWVQNDDVIFHIFWGINLSIQCHIYIWRYYWSNKIGFGAIYPDSENIYEKSPTRKINFTSVESSSITTRKIGTIEQKSSYAIERIR